MVRVGDDLDGFIEEFNREDFSGVPKKLPAKALDLKCIDQVKLTFRS